MESRGRRASPYPQPPSSPEATSGALRVWGVVGVGGCRWFGVLESCMVVRGVAWSYPGACGRTWRRAVVPWRGSKVRPRASAYDRALPRTTARFRVRPRASAYDRAAGRRAQSTGRRGTRESAMSGPAGHRRKPISPRNRIDPGAGDADALRASYECGELDRPRCRGCRRPPGAPAAAPARCSEPVRTAQDAGGRPVPRRRRGRLCR